MRQNISLTADPYLEETVRRYGFNCAMGLFLADALGGLWYVSGHGVGWELVGPHRCCVIADFKTQALDFARNDTLSTQEIRLTLQDCEPLPGHPVEAPEYLRPAVKAS